MYSKSFPLCLAACATGILGIQNLSAEQASQPKQLKQPNIIFILCDDLGFGDLGYQFQNQRAKTGDRSEPWMKTPNLDKMASKGVQMPFHYCPAPVCAPSRASLILGQSQGHANVRDNQFDKAIENNHTMATVLKAAGYSTAAIGKWGLQGQGKDKANWVAHPLNRGFDYYFGYMRHGDGHEHYPKEGLYRNKKEVYENHTDIADQLDKCYTADLWTAITKKWIIEETQKNRSEKPFFVFLAFDTPHAVIELPTQAYPKGGGLKGGLQWLGKPGEMINTASGTIDSWMHPDYATATYDHDKNPATPELAWPDVYKRYATSTRRIDSAVGDLVQLLRDLKIADNTVIVFSTDNGPSKESYLPEKYDPNFFNNFGPFDGIKRDLLQGGTRVSALAYWPGHFMKGKVIATPSISYDWLPTFAELAGVAAPAVADGVSLVPSLTGSGTQQPSTVYIEYFEGGKTPDYDEFLPEHQGKKRNQMQMVIQNEYIGLRYNIQAHSDPFEVYDLMKDPQQGHNLAGNPNMDKIVQQMQDKVMRVRRPDASAKRPYDDEPVSAVEEMSVNPGIVWKSYTGSFQWVPQLSAMTPSGSGITALPKPSVAGIPSGLTLSFSGFIRIPSAGEYTFSLKTDKGAFFRLHDIALIDADYGYQGGTEMSGKINLKAGLHPFRLNYITTHGNQPLLDIQWSGPGFMLQPIPVAAYFHSAKN